MAVTMPVQFPYTEKKSLNDQPFGGRKQGILPLRTKLQGLLNFSKPLIMVELLQLFNFSLSYDKMRQPIRILRFVQSEYAALEHDDIFLFVY